MFIFIRYSYFWKMKKEMRAKLADLLDRVKDPENGTSISQMNLIAGIKYNNPAKEIEVYMYSVKPAKACCVVFQLTAYAQIEEMLKKEIEEEFPNDIVVFKNP